MIIPNERASELVKRVDSSLRYPIDLPWNVMKIQGMIGLEFKRFLNTICHYEDVRYLELGTYKGASLTAASYINPGMFVGVDNFTYFGGREEVQELNKSASYPFVLIDGDHWQEETKQQVAKWGKYNVYYYDGDHQSESQAKALIEYMPFMEEEFIYIVDDWNWEGVRTGTVEGLAKTGTNIVAYTAQFSSPMEIKAEKGVLSIADGFGWWNGCGIFVLTKKKEK